MFGAVARTREHIEDCRERLRRNGPNAVALFLVGIPDRNFGQGSGASMKCLRRYYRTIRRGRRLSNKARTERDHHFYVGRSIAAIMADVRSARLSSSSLRSRLIVKTMAASADFLGRIRENSPSSPSSRAAVDRGNCSGILRSRDGTAGTCSYP